MIPEGRFWRGIGVGLVFVAVIYAALALLGWALLRVT